MKIAIIFDLLMILIFWPVGILCTIATLSVAYYQKTGQVDIPAIIVNVILLWTFWPIGMITTVATLIALHNKSKNKKPRP